MTFHILTLFPDMIRQGLNNSITGRAMEKGLIDIDTVNIRNFSAEKHGKVDDYTYGGGAGMLMQAQPVFDAWKSVCEGIECRAAEDGEDSATVDRADSATVDRADSVAVDRAGSTAEDEAAESLSGKDCVPAKTPARKLRTIYVTPQGRPFDQNLAWEFAKEKELILLCGHYEGIDERALEETVTDYVSIGDYVLTGGELAAMVIVDAVSRLVPGVLGNESSAEAESFHGDLLEYPQYSRPEVWHGKSVPEVLLGGNHREITAWRLEQAKARTRERRPDLYARYEQKQRVIKRLSKHKRDNIHMMESLARGNGEILYEYGDDVLVYERRCKLAIMTVTGREKGEEMIRLLPDDTESAELSQEFMIPIFQERFGMHLDMKCVNSCYTQKVQLPVKHKDIRLLTMAEADYVMKHYSHSNRAYIEDRIQCGALYGAFVEGEIAGFAGEHEEGSLGLLFVHPDYRRLGIGQALQAYCINRHLALGYTPYGQVEVDNDVSFKLQAKQGLYLSEGVVWWMSVGDKWQWGKN